MKTNEEKLKEVVRKLKEQRKRKSKAEDELIDSGDKIRSLQWKFERLTK
ncbi:hypothetical protein LCGC14_0509200 [marine sediment metagenome]|uniref:Uncharacterized protein n=1 Tax=marine sediment metagenome TaxID=412755 RepID=A0A0F9S6C2_9ZZZZ